MSKELFQETAGLWSQAFEEELLDDLDSEVALGAYYAKLAIDGTVELTGSGIRKVELAKEALGELLGGGHY